MNYEIAAIKDLIPYANNTKTHTPEQIKKIASSIKEFGFINPVIVDRNNGIIAGHARVQAAQLLNLETVPVLRVEHLSEAQKKAYIIADNRLAEVGSGWDMELLQLELESLKELEFDIEPLGFDFPSPPEFKPDLGDGDDEGGEVQPREYKLVVTLEDDLQMQELFDELKERGLKVKAG